MDRENYDDIAPYTGERAEQAVRTLREHPQILRNFATILLDPTLPTYEQDVNGYTQQIIEKLKDTHSYDDFQRYITSGYFIPSVLKRSVTEFSHSGGKDLDKSESYLYFSNHRDIVLDCALLDYALLEDGRQLCEMAIGDNLIKNKNIELLFKLNGAITVKRSLPLREKYLDSIHLSQYFVKKITEDRKSIWVAQKSGRSKDGIDKTAPGIIKMLYLSQRRAGVSFSSLIRNCRIVPVAVSYEYDPCDINKGREEVWRNLNKGEYSKKKYEDLINLIRGLRKFKGRVHISIGKPLVEKDYKDQYEVTADIDRQIHLNYKLWPTNCFAYDFLEKTDRFKDVYADFDKDAFLARYEHLKPAVRNSVLNAYANPVRSYLSAL
jgi:1-acyl-sn-glycerol-3-phosphate acyltransferase